MGSIPPGFIADVADVADVADKRHEAAPSGDGLVYEPD
ncbi:hypothetical protein BN2537_7309 [Streptomyces venezuelae]|nr:hypothetical protein BN2537_7309 [Streptomyces venezuelae]